MNLKKIAGGKCHCGKKLPSVLITQTPYEFCSTACKQRTPKTKIKSKRGKS